MASASASFRERSDVASAEPLSTIALSNKPSVSGDAICEITFVPPPDSPMIVTLSGSPPKAAMLSRIHSSEALRSSVP